MLQCITKTTRQRMVPITLIPQKTYKAWLKSQNEATQRFLKHYQFQAKPGEYCLWANEQGEVSRVFVGVESSTDLTAVGALPLQLPSGCYCLEIDTDALALQRAAIAWGMGAYQFTRYKKAERKPAVLFVPRHCDYALVENILHAVYLTRDLINTAPDDMMPMDLSEETSQLAKQYHAVVRHLIDDELLEENYPAIFTVGRGSIYPPRLIDMVWGDEKAPKLTLIGKGVCFDSGGLDIKSTVGMSLMKKDMGGAANVLGLARMIMQANLPVRLRVLIPAVDNAVSGEAYHPSDVITMRNKKTVEVTNTDAEGRLVMADALVEACREKPDLLIDIATLTGAARVAVGPKVAAMFTKNASLAQDVLHHANDEFDYIWQLPLTSLYSDYLKSRVADIANASSMPYAGAITAGLFLNEFVDEHVNWLHFDLMGWNVEDSPGHPLGGEAQAIRALFAFLRQRYSSRH